MSRIIARRDFLKAIPSTAAVLAYASHVPAALADTHPALTIESFEFQGVRLSKSRSQQQVEGARQYYLNLSDDDILHGYSYESSHGGRRLPTR